MIYKAFYCLLLSLPLYAFECKSTFTLQTQNNLTSLEILEELAKTCHFNLIYLDSLSPQILSQTKPRLHIKNLNASSLLKLLLEEFHFTFDNTLLKIAFLYTQTYELNYISTSRIGSSSTDVILSPHSTLQENYYTSLQDRPNLSSQTFNPNTTGRSGTKIFSIDENNFWGELTQEISEVVYRPEDKWIKQIPKAITINKHAGLITLTASKAQHKRFAHYLSQLNQKIHAQVLIDVHILIINHDKSKTAGINWNEFYNLGNLSIPPPSLKGSFIQLGTSGLNMEINIFSQGITLDRIVEFLESYGETRSLSNPKVLTLNNQPAIISVGSVLRYTQNSIFQSSSQGSNIQNSLETYPSIFSGVLLDVTPSIQGDEIILRINPSITRAKDTALENESNALKTPPNLSTNQLSSIVKVKSGEKIILGGLISNIHHKKEFKIPLLGDIPILSYLFKYKWNQQFNEEMVIIISPQIIQSPKQQESSFPSDFKQLLREIRILKDQNETP